MHIPVLLDEVIEGLRAFQGGDFLDCTLGGGGHANAILEAHFSNTVVGTDRDIRAVNRCKERFKDKKVEIVHSDFKGIKGLFGTKRFDGILADLGLSTFQLEEERGFSFKDKVALDMRMDESQELDALTLVNNYDQHALIKIFKEGGVRDNAKRIAQELIKARPITNAHQLAQIVAQSVKSDHTRHPATVVFQAIRIAVNDELNQIHALLDEIPKLVKPGARVAIISFHSLEDEIVTKRLRRWSSGSTAPAYLMQPDHEPALGKLLTKKAITPAADEMSKNPASRSARLRVFEFLN